MPPCLLVVVVMVQGWSNGASHQTSGQSCLSWAIALRLQQRVPRGFPSSHQPCCLARTSQKKKLWHGSSGPTAAPAGVPHPSCPAWQRRRLPLSPPRPDPELPPSQWRQAGPWLQPEPAAAGPAAPAPACPSPPAGSQSAEPSPAGIGSSMSRVLFIMNDKQTAVKHVCLSCLASWSSGCSTCSCRHGWLNVSLGCLELVHLPSLRRQLVITHGAFSSRHIARRLTWM